MTAKFWVGGTGTWDNTNDANWSLSTGGANNTTHPTSGDTATLDAASGGGTVTIAANLSLQSITLGAFTGTWDNSVNNNSVTLSAATPWSQSGAGTRSIKLGTATYTLSATNANWSAATTTNLTFTGTGATISFTGAASANNRTFQGGGLSYGTVTVNANSSGGSFTMSGANTIGTLNIAAPNYVVYPSSATTTITTLNVTGTSSSAEVGFASSTVSTTATISIAANAPTMTWMAFRDMTGTGGATFAATNSFDLGHNTGITITAPSAGVTSNIAALGRGLH